jgi:hypothetical protein
MQYQNGLSIVANGRYMSCAAATPKAGTRAALIRVINITL